MDASVVICWHSLRAEGGGERRASVNNKRRGSVARDVGATRRGVRLAVGAVCVSLSLSLPPIHMMSITQCAGCMLRRHDTTPNFCASSNSLKVKLNEADAKNAGENFSGDLQGFLFAIITVPERTGRYGWGLLRIRAREGTTGD